MKQLYIVRHADAKSAEGPAYNDFDRTLSPEGINRISIVGNRFKKQGVNLSLIVTSPAQRTLATAMILADLLHYPREAIRQVASIYQATVSDLLGLIAEFEDSIPSILLVGHNPAVTDLVNYFGITPPLTLSPASLCAFTLQSAHWSDIFTAHLQQNYVEIP
jgi:phosphohistidine phosphatase